MWIYDNNGAYIGFTYNGVEYYYVYNLQGDVEAITDATGAIVAKYMYDTWGYVEYEFNYNGSINIAEINPIRYRGYYYDSERGLYYLNSRYYDPFMCRFINADNVVSGVGGDIQGYNMFSYCMNNPVNKSDSTGNWPKWIGKAIAVVAVAVVVVVAVAVTVSTFGAGSAAGVMAITTALTIAARATEVAVLQAKKSTGSVNKSTGKNSSSNSSGGGNRSGGGGEKKSSGQVAVDVVESLYDNGLQIFGITPYTKAGGLGADHFLNKQVSEIFGETVTLRDTLSNPKNGALSYVFSAYAWYKTVISIISDDPVEMAEQRGYTLR